MKILEQAILETTQVWEREGVERGQIGPIIGAVDETFLQCMMLVFMDLASGYLLFEESAEDRTYDTWHTRVTTRLKTLGTRLLYLVSDRAKPLVKLGKTGLGCLSVPDLFQGWPFDATSSMNWSKAMDRLFACGCGKPVKL